MSLYGVDTSATDKVRPGILVSGPTLVAEAVYRRLKTKRGTLLEDPNYGEGVDDYLSLELTPFNLARIPSELRAGVMKDDRVESCDVSSSSSGTGASITLEVLLECECGEGPFALTVRITRESVDIIIGKRGAA